MSERVVIFPGPFPLPPVFLSDAERRQYQRECAALREAMREPPPRTRPLLVCQRPEGGP